ncbi:MAG TPA: COX15/CtaA family protein [Anaerolineae bacterium]|nr:COX15/CtaA family protein [Anaerolineae bacterium]
MKLDGFAKYAWGVLAFNLGVILWGAYVRATGSGAGCGSHWPFCNGEIIPRNPQVETMIEFTHRLSSGLALLLVVGLVVWAFRLYPKKGHSVRWGAGFSMFFIITEALVGAGLVLFELVAQDTSSARAVVIAVHLMNTFLLLAALTLTAWWASGGRPVQLKGQGWLGSALGIAFLALLVLGASGAITALGDTLFPANSLAEGLQQKFSPTAHLLVRLRLWHPLIAIAVGAYVILVIGLFNARRSTPLARQIGRIFTVLYFIQLGSGAFNVYLLAPTWMQLWHLLLADALWIVLVIFAAAGLAQPATQANSVDLVKTSPQVGRTA